MKGTISTRVMVAAVAVAVAMAAGSLSADHSRGSYHWARTANPFTLAVGDNVNSAWDSYLSTAISDWSASTALNLVRVAGGTRPRQCKATTGRIEVCNDAYGQDETFNDPNLGTCMDYTSDPNGGGSYGPPNEHPNRHDYDQLDIIYRHRDNTSTVGSLGRGPQPAGPAERARELGAADPPSRNGRVHIYEVDLGKGRKILTHVFWADPEGTAAPNGDRQP